MQSLSIKYRLQFDLNIVFSYKNVLAKTTNLQDLRHSKFASDLKKENRINVIVTFTFFYVISY